MRTFLNVYRWLCDTEAPDFLTLPAAALGAGGILGIALMLGDAIKHAPY